jgi:hypothetical protein
MQVHFLLWQLFAQLEDAILLVKENIVIVLDLDLCHFFGNTFVIFLHLISLWIGEALQLLELLVPLKNN